MHMDITYDRYSDDLRHEVRARASAHPSPSPTALCPLPAPRRHPQRRITSHNIRDQETKDDRSSCPAALLGPHLPMSGRSRGRAGPSRPGQRRLPPRPLPPQDARLRFRRCRRNDVVGHIKHVGAVRRRRSGTGDRGGGSSASYVKESASLTVKDTLSGPAIFIETEPNASNTEDEEVRQDGTVVPMEPTVCRKTIPLKKVGRVVAVDGGFMGVGASTSMVAVMSRGKLHNNGVGEELCRFNVLDERGRKADGDDRERVVNKLMCLVEWNRRRMERAGVSDDGANDDDDEDDECKEVSGTGKKGVPHGRAAKAAYFAKREIELTKTRREREQRKARYLKESGGLKYTAIAMANNAGMT